MPKYSPDYLYYFSFFLALCRHSAYSGTLLTHVLYCKGCFVFFFSLDNRCVIVVNCGFNLHFLKTTDILFIVLIFHVSILFCKVSFVIYHLSISFVPLLLMLRVLYIKSHNSQPHKHLNKPKG